jgi:hypothetical protein
MEKPEHSEQRKEAPNQNPRIFSPQSIHEVKLPKDQTDAINGHLDPS